MSIQVRPTTPSDLNAVLALLAEARLPTEGVSQHFADFLVALANERIVGCVGLEKYGDAALFRSLAVAPDWRGKGLGVQLTAQALSYAQANAVQKVVLLTTTASEFFARHFSFVPTERNQFNDIFGDSPEWNLSVCASAACMVLSVP